MFVQDNTPAQSRRAPPSSSPCHYYFVTGLGPSWSQESPDAPAAATLSRRFGDTTMLFLLYPTVQHACIYIAPSSIGR